ncbi:MAG: phosphoglucosamine mutase [Elusimicrobiota bacterium]
MAERLFGTDGVRGIPGRPPLDGRTVELLAYAAALESRATLAVLGRDTRESGPALGRSLTRGLAAAGCRVLDIGVAPTPAVSYLVPRRGAGLGIVVSASHNPPEFNGVKFFSKDGRKASEDFERKVEKRIGSRLPAAKAKRTPCGVQDYKDFLRSTFPFYRDLSGLRIVFDGANGSGAAMGPRLLRDLGAEVLEIGTHPNGKNINRACGATDTARMRKEVRRRRAHCGLSLDGDADRVILSDERGGEFDGDSIIALCALHLHRRRELRGGKVVLTVMANLGLVRGLERHGIGTIEVGVGDRNVTEALGKHGLVLGGEPSGHVVFRQLAPTGDGLLTALQTLAAWRESGGALSRHQRLFERYPQILRNVRVERRVPVEALPAFQRRVLAARKQLGGDGRVFVRYSGTEPLLRILVEGRRLEQVSRIADGLACFFAEEARITV